MKRFRIHFKELKIHFETMLSTLSIYCTETRILTTVQLNNTDMVTKTPNISK